MSNLDFSHVEPYYRLSDIEAPFIARELIALGSLIREERIFQGLTQGELADRLSWVIERHTWHKVLLESEFIGDLEAGRIKKISRRRVLWIAEALHVDLYKTATLLEVAGFDAFGWFISVLAGSCEQVQTSLDGKLPTIDEACATTKDRYITMIRFIRSDAPGLTAHLEKK